MIILNTEQQRALKSISDFLDSENSIFILRGYAGTGKTTLLASLVKWMSEKHLMFQLMAPTGRASMVLKDKTGFNATTIHKGIYKLDHMDVETHDDVSDTSICYHFPVIDDGPIGITIVDEASMVSSMASHQELWRFGSGNLLSDLLEYAKVDKGGKIIFIGDPAQLPPVGDNKSNALDEHFFENLNLKTVSFELTEVVRQDKDSLVFANAMKVRDLLSTSKLKRTSLHLDHDEKEVFDMPCSEMVDAYCKMFPSPEIGDSAILVYENSKASQINKEIRAQLFGEADNPVQPNDILIVVSNYYGGNEGMGSVCLMNGEFVKVISASERVETRNITVIHKTPTGKYEIKVPLSFRDVTIQTQEGNIASIKILDFLLNNGNRELTLDETKALFIDFCIRNQHLKPNSQPFIDSLKIDPYFKALHVKYGYCITGHKSQGGEWDTVFVDYRNTTLDDDSLRWIYTVTTRARRKLFANNMPNVEISNKKTANQIKPLPKSYNTYYVPKTEPDTQNVSVVDETPFHKPTDDVALKMKYWEVISKLEGSAYKVQSVESKPYREIYTFSTPHGLARFDFIYKKGFAFNNIEAHASETGLANLLNEEKAVNVQRPSPATLDYSPSTPWLATLFDIMKRICADSEITIVNVAEFVEHYHVVYALQTAECKSALDFVFNASGMVTYINPYSEKADTDSKLKCLIDNLDCQL